MKPAALPPNTLLIVGALAVAGLALYLARRGVAGVASDLGTAAGTAAVQVVTGVATGVTDAASTVIGIPTTQQTSDDPKLARWVLDNYGYLDAFNWFGPATLWTAETMAAGTGTQPTGTSALAKAHPQPAAGSDGGAWAWLSSGW